MEVFTNATGAPVTGIGSPTAISAKGGIPMYNTTNTLPEQIRSRSVALFNRQLAAVIDLHAQVKQAHGNVRGLTFADIAIHELFDKIAEVVEGYSDKIAERARTIAARRMAPPGRLEPFNDIPPRTGFGRVPILWKQRRRSGVHVSKTTRTFC
jgi:hypothetical protein